jgi:hypothetical protein
MGEQAAAEGLRFHRLVSWLAGTLPPAPALMRCRLRLKIPDLVGAENDVTAADLVFW